MTMKQEDAKTFVNAFPHRFLRAYSYIRKPISTPIEVVTDEETGEETVIRGPKHPTMYKNRRRGVVVAVLIGKEVFYGWSLCHKTYDEFNTGVGVTIALKRALASAEPNYFHKGYPQSIVDTLVDMEGRAARYFKGCSA